MSEPNPGPLFNVPLPESKLDADAVVRASRRRRRSRVIAFGGAAAVIVLGAVGGTYVLTVQPTSTTSASAGTSHPGGIPAAGATIHTVGPNLGSACQMQTSIPGDTVLCGCSAVSLAPLTGDISATLSYPAESVGSRKDGLLTITNNTQATINGTADTPISFIVSRGIIVSPVGTDDSAAHSVELAPGASETIAVALPGLNCAGSPAPAGQYSMAAFFDLTLASGQHLGVVAPITDVTITR